MILVAAPAMAAQSRPAQARSASARPVATAPAAAVVLDQVTVIDVEHGRRLPAQRVVIRGNRIQALGSARTVRVPSGARVVNARGKYLIPGLWDLHHHPTVWVQPPDALPYHVNGIYRLLIANGITGIRDPGASVPLDTFRVWKREIAAGRRVGPRLIVSGPNIEQGAYGCTRQQTPPTCAENQVFIDQPEEARHLVDSLKAAGADFIKIHNVKRPIWFALAREARRAGIPFGGHFEEDTALATLDGLNASDSGAAILDHGMWVDACGRGQDTVQSLTRCAAVAARLRRNHTWFTGGAGGVLPPLELLSTRPQRTGAELAAAVPDSVKRGRGCHLPWLAYVADLPWLPGPDYPLAGDPLAMRWMLLEPTLCGVPPSWALRAATLEPARALGLADSLGTVAAGNVADLVLLAGDPLADIWNITRVEAVLADGRYFDRAALDRLAAEAAAAELEVQRRWAVANKKAKAAEANEKASRPSVP